MSVMDFDHRTVRRLEGDVARTMKPEEITRVHRERFTEHQEIERARYAHFHEDLSKANLPRIHDLVHNNKLGARTRKLASYAGQKSRGTPTEVFLPDPKDDGWEGIEPSEGG